MLDYEKLPESLRPGVKRYVEEGILPGHFLGAVFSNNLKLAFCYADDDNLKVLHEIVKWITWEVPAPCQGSDENMVRWHEQGGLKGKGIDPETLKGV